MREKRVEVRLNNVEYKWLKEYAEKEEIPMGEAMRRFLNSFRLLKNP